MDDGDDEVMEDTPDVEMVSHPQVLRMLPPRKDSMAKVLDRRLGEVVKLLQKNNTAIKTLAEDIWDLSGVLEELFKALKAAMMTLVNWAQNDKECVIFVLKEIDTPGIKVIGLLEAQPVPGKVPSYVHRGWCDVLRSIPGALGPWDDGYSFALDDGPVPASNSEESSKVISKPDVSPPAFQCSQDF
ncbi:hypothetical protein PISMIDRAFT_18692 [Pisolithus microcarpus 441]|uniref:Uncharacterized protein n=1 Tax=Pisolithus microcarpus 441 TaxID=765257 RepID=A0A0C9Y6I9_9AGAM|nr:hypothetical protein PISMIDRAFT_18692 [Pisolithus microcarpus 441]